MMEKIKEYCYETEQDYRSETELVWKIVTLPKKGRKPETLQALRNSAKESKKISGRKFIMCEREMESMQ